MTFHFNSKQENKHATPLKDLSSKIRWQHHKIIVKNRNKYVEIRNKLLSQNGREVLHRTPVNNTKKKAQ